MLDIMATSDTGHCGIQWCWTLWQPVILDIVASSDAGHFGIQWCWTLWNHLLCQIGKSLIFVWSLVIWIFLVMQTLINLRKNHLTLKSLHIWVQCVDLPDVHQCFYVIANHWRCCSTSSVVIRLGHFSQIQNVVGIFEEKLVNKFFRVIWVCWIRIFCLPSWQMTPSCFIFKIQNGRPQNVVLSISRVLIYLGTWFWCLNPCFHGQGIQ